MSKVDQFESVFKSAAKPLFQYEAAVVQSVAVITDLEAEEADKLCQRVRGFLRALESERELSWSVITGDRFHNLGDVLQLVAEEKPDLVCTYRHLHSDAWQWPYSLGEMLDVLTQVTDIPVLVLPHPQSGRESDRALKDTNSVMAISDNLTGDDRLVNYAFQTTAPGGTLYLAHLEAGADFERLMDVISKIPSIDTEHAREDILKQMLKEPGDYIQSCRKALEDAEKQVKTEDIVLVGHYFQDFIKLVEERQVDLLVFNTKQEEQLAMHGLAYALAVEIRHIPLLML